MKNGIKIAAVLLCTAVLFAGCSAQDAEQTSLSETLPSADTALESETSAVAQTSETPAETSQTTAETTMPTANEEGAFDFGTDVIELSSEDLVDGVWADVISNTMAGNNVSPALSWEPVEGAQEYVIYMVDTTAYYWYHWKMDGVTETNLEQGFGGTSYIGPYPPPGSTHTYDIYVVALRNSVDRVRGSLNTQNENFPSFLYQLDTDIDGNSGNIIAMGRLSGTFTAP
ncbi:MAG: hypothetical protein K6F79_04895 [Saccharofermentans sp.]|nr:hypothetical protein [Saccharofermentans sp.]